MSNSLLTLENALTTVFIALSYSAWGFFGKYLNVGGGWLASVVCLATLFAVTLLSVGDIANSHVPSLRSLGLLFVAGFANGVACILASRMMVRPDIPSAIFMVTITVLMVIISPLMGWVMHGENFVPRQWVGIAVIIVGILLLQK